MRIKYAECDVYGITDIQNFANTTQFYYFAS